MIREASGFEMIANLFTGKRRYRCRDCYFAFRMKDRRTESREVPEATAAKKKA